MVVTVVCPEGYKPDAEIMAWASANGDFTCTDDVMAGVCGADVVYTDVWTSMGQEEESARRLADFAGYQVNAEVMAAAAKDAIVLHCLPAHREEEITAEVFEVHAKPIFDQAENRLHAQKAVLAMLLAADKLN
jgi:ornithine carbamoyltransferase